MRKFDGIQGVLPRIQQYKTQQKTVKDVLKEIKQRKMLINQRIKTQVEDQQQYEKQDTQTHFRERIATEVPYIVHRKSYYSRFQDNHTSLYDIKQREFSPKINEKYSKKQEDSERSSKVQSEKRKHHSIMNSVTAIQKRESIIKTRKQISKQVQDLLQTVPMDPRERNDKNIFNLKRYLIQNNMFFAKINETITTCLLKLNRIIYVQKNQILYRSIEQKNAIYVIFSGALQLYCVKMKTKRIIKVCGSGETIGQQIIFNNFKDKKKLAFHQSARALSGSFLVEIKMQNNKKMFEEIMRYGYKVAFNEMQSIIKRNFITKNWLRSQRQRIQNAK